MYIDNENLTIEIDISYGNKIFLNNISKILKTKNLKQVIFKMENKKVNKAKYEKFIINSIKNNSHIQFFIPSSITMTHHHHHHHHHYAVVSENTELDITNLKKEEKIFYYYDLLNENSLVNLYKIINETDNIIIIYFQSYEQASLLDFKKAIMDISEMKKKRPIHLSNLFISTSLVRSHPCNMFMCSGENCHSSKGKFPRYLLVNTKGVFPYKVKNESFMFLNDISNTALKYNFTDYLENIYLYSTAYDFFKSTVRKIYEKYIFNKTLGYKVILWDMFLDMELS